MKSLMSTSAEKKGERAGQPPTNCHPLFTELRTTVSAPAPGDLFFPRALTMGTRIFESIHVSTGCLHDPLHEHMRQVPCLPS